MSKRDTHRADERAFLDTRGSDVGAAPNGKNPATIMEKAVRERITDSAFFKDRCFGLNEADVAERCARHVRFVGGTYGTSQRPTPFLCLAFKLLQLAPGDDVLAVYLGHGGDRFKYLRALACFYVRLTRRPVDVYRTLEPFLEDRRKLRRRARAGTSLTYVDQFVDDLLVKERVCGTSLVMLPKRELLEDMDFLEPRVSPLGNIEDLLDDDDDDAGADGKEDDEGDDGDEDAGKEEGNRERSDAADRRRNDDEQGSQTPEPESWRMSDSRRGSEDRPHQDRARSAPDVMEVDGKSD